ncbi:MAG: hypothetical protein Q4P84_04355 [Elusimicrobiales bacterium]|nr:hypothetical protein [Elusimicrobiales bacterium]
MSLETALKNCFTGRQENRFLYLIPPGFPAFEGHFPGNPLLPAVCQTGLCADALSRQEGKPLEISAVARAKFMRPVLPGAQVQITLTPRPDGKTLCELADPESGQKFSQIIVQVKERV